jgi:hypothetical protein
MEGLSVRVDALGLICEYNSKSKGLFAKSAKGLGLRFDLENSRGFFAKLWDFLEYLELFLY